MKKESSQTNLLGLTNKEAIAYTLF